jgi:hypothetical protein
MELRQGRYGQTLEMPRALDTAWPIFTSTLGIVQRVDDTLNVFVALTGEKKSDRRRGGRRFNRSLHDGSLREHCRDTPRSWRSPRTLGPPFMPAVPRQCYSLSVAPHCQLR